MSERRPNPDDLLNTIQKQEEASRRGRLYVFFGMCPGVGKTFAMLKAAHEQKTLGSDIVIGVVETHGRKETEELIQDLEIISKRKIEYKGSELFEMDIDAILKRQPQFVVVDELAHTNAPGSRHIKRYQDVDELLNAGIHVLTTINVQHIESRSDLVSQITGSHIRETVPDSFLQTAHQVVLLDLTPEELLKRLKEGKVYLGERAEAASENFFKIENITALRELALRFTAEKVDYQLRDQMNLKQIIGPWNTNERLLVAISHSPYSGRLIKSARRMAFNLEAPWIALYIDQGLDLIESDKKTLHKNINLARELGAEIVTTKDQDIAAAIKRVCEERNVTQVIMGRPDRRFFRDFLAKGTLLDQLVRETSKIDIHVVRQERKPKFIGFHLKFPELRSDFISYWYTLWTLIAVSVASFAAVPWIGYRSVGFIFLLVVLIVASLASRGPIIFAAMASSIIWNFFFIPPLYTFTISAPEDFMMCFAYFVVAMVAGYLAHRIRRQEDDLRSRETRASILYEFGKKIAQAKTNLQIASHAEEAISQMIDANIAILLSNSRNELTKEPLNYVEVRIDDKVFAVAQWTYQNQKKSGWSTDTLSSSPCLCLPLKGKTKTIGVLLLFPKNIIQLSLDQESFLENIVNHIGIAMERNILEAEAKESYLLKESEKLHQTLLNSVSHELRTPITSIMGAATALQDDSTFKNDTARPDLINNLISSSQRLNRVVENLLDMSRISSGMLQLKKELFEVNDFVNSFLQRTSSLFKNHSFVFKPTQDVYIKGDDKLLEHVMTNLVANAASYSASGTKIEIKVELKNNKVEVSVLDEGKGIDETAIQQLFEPFYRVPGTPAGGTGLGLSICKSIVEAHGGYLLAKNRSDAQGACFTFALNSEEIDLKGDQP